MAAEQKLFEQIDGFDKETTNIVVGIDASGSTVLSKFEGDNDVWTCQIEKTVEYLKSRGCENDTRMDVIYWNSPPNDNRQIPQNMRFVEDGAPWFTDGIYSFPFKTQLGKLQLQSMIVKEGVNSYCLTSPGCLFKHLVDNNIVDNKKNTLFVYVTDGDITNSSNGGMTMTQFFVNQMSRFFRNHGQLVEFVIITVQPIDRDFSGGEGMQVAGCDVFNALSRNGLTNKVSKFMSYTRNHMDVPHIHIDQVKVPAGFIPFGSNYFSPAKMPQFVDYLKDLIESKQSEVEHVKIVQNLSRTLHVLTKDMDDRMKHQKIHMMSTMFQNTELDPMFVKHILIGAVKDHNAGSAQLFGQYRASLKNLYKQANDMLSKTVCDAIGVQNTCSTYLFNSSSGDNDNEQHIIIVPRRMACTTTVLKNRRKNVTFPSSAVKINDVVLPIVPIFYDMMGTRMTEQCLRQWARQIVAKKYRTSPMDDICMYYVAADALRVVLSEKVEENVKASWCEIARTMFRKKRYKKDVTELEFFESGQFPTPNRGSPEKFLGMMESIANHLNLNIDVKPMTMWWLLCQVLDYGKVDKVLCANQIMHCRDDLVADFPDMVNENALVEILQARRAIKPVTVHKIKLECMLDYECPITLDDTSASGGKMIVPHQARMGAGTCSPRYVLSDSGYKSMVNNCVCPICYKILDHQLDFQDVGPREEIKMGFFDASNVNNHFASKQIVSQHNSLVATKTQMSLRDIGPSEEKDNDVNKILVVFNGPVGAGKSTIAQRMADLLQTECEKKGKTITTVIEGVDKYCKTGTPIGAAIGLVEQAFRTVKQAQTDYIVAFVDTCGEKRNGKMYFNVNFAGWTIVQLWANRILGEDRGYQAWSLRNVLQRGRNRDGKENYWLNPYGAGMKTCLNVHRQKCQRLGFKYMLQPSRKKSVEWNIEYLNKYADEYEKKIRSVDEEAMNHLTNIAFKFIVGSF